MRRHVWIVPKSGDAGSGHGRSVCLSCGLIRWRVWSERKPEARTGILRLRSLYGRDAIHWKDGRVPCEPRR